MRWPFLKQLAVRWGLLGGLAALTAFIAYRAVSGVLGKVGHAAALLDDSYIHFQYAKAIAQGHPMRFQAGEPVTSGATSLLWPVVLAPFWLLGCRDDAIVWPAWTFAFAALGGLAWEAARLTSRLAGRAASAGAGAMVLAFGGFVWSAASGMEVVPFAWAIARTARRASEWAEASPPDRNGKRLSELVVLSWVAALLRPEGAVIAIFAFCTLLFFRRPAETGPRRRAIAAIGALGALGATMATPLLLLAMTGSARSSTAIVKLLPGNPYHGGRALALAVEGNAKILTSKLLNGEAWAEEFLPNGGAIVAVLGLFCIAWLGYRQAVLWRAAAVLLIALMVFAPCFYVTFLWNRLRYLWPFATGWVIGLACLARVAGDLAAWRPGGRLATPILCGVFVGLFASKLGWVLDDIAQSASGIDRQQVALGRWAQESLPLDARVGVNDTGAIAYFGDRKTFDIVGLTSPNEARYWVAGVGSRLEHYERLLAQTPSALPTHFIVYPEWMGIDAILGRPLREATVYDSTILGGQTMRAYLADWSMLGTGERAWTGAEGSVVDALDVADLDSEKAHEYDLAGARDGEQVIRLGTSPAGDPVIDAGRAHRTTDRFIAHLRPGGAAHGIVRLEAPTASTVHVLVDRTEVGAFTVDDDAWQERSFDVPESMVTASTRVEVRSDDAPMTTYHYWFTQ